MITEYLVAYEKLKPSWTKPDEDLLRPFNDAKVFSQWFQKTYGAAVFAEELRLIEAHVDLYVGRWREVSAG